MLILYLFHCGILLKIIYIMHWKQFLPHKGKGNDSKEQFILGTRAIKIHTVK